MSGECERCGHHCMDCVCHMPLVPSSANPRDAELVRVPDMEAALIAQDAELKRLRAERGEIEAVIADLLTEILPWVEAQIDDPAYKPGTVRAVANRIRAALGEKP